MQYKPKEFLIIDGYNIINAWPSLKQLASEDLLCARETLCEKMSEYANFRGIEVIIVFDAYRVKNRSRNFEKKYKSVVVEYTKEDQTADSFIEKLISNMDKRDFIRVATNDWAEQQIVLGKGKSRLSARELRIEVEGANKKIKKTIQNVKARNTLDSLVDKKTLEKLEKLRRGN